MDAKAVLDREFLAIRARLLDLAAALDRIQRAGGEVADDGRWEAIHRALARLQSPDPGRATDVQHVFSLPYDPNWMTAFGLDAESSSA